jgi:hypothetical protein
LATPKGLFLNYFWLLDGIVRLLFCSVGVHSALKSGQIFGLNAAITRQRKTGITKEVCVMKNTIKTLGIIALVAVIGFYFAACDDGSSGDGDKGPGPLVLTDFYGYWEPGGINYNRYYYDISAEKISFRVAAGTYYDSGPNERMNETLTSVVPAININELNKSQFPNGFVFASNGGVRTLYMSTDKTRFMNGEGGGTIFIKSNPNDPYNPGGVVHKPWW